MTVMMNTILSLILSCNSFPGDTVVKRECSKYMSDCAKAPENQSLSPRALYDKCDNGFKNR